MKYSVIIFLLFLIASISFTQLGCTSTSSNRDSDNGVKLVLYDSVKVETIEDDIKFTDFSVHKQLFVGFGRKSFNIYIIQKDGQICSSFNHVGGGPMDYSRVNALSFFNDSTLMVTTYQDVCFYDLKGNCLSKRKLNLPILLSQYANNHKCFGLKEGNDTIIIAAINDYKASLMSGIQQFGVENISTGIFSTIGYHAESIYSNDALLVAARNYFASVYNKKLYVLYAYDPNVYCYSVSPSVVFEKKYKLGNPLFEDLIVPNSSNADQGSQLTLFSKNPRYNGFQVCDSIYYVVCKEGSRDHDIREDSEEFNSVSQVKRDWLQLYSPSKKYSDISLEHIGTNMQLIAVPETDKLVFISKNSEVENEIWILFGELNFE